MAASPSSRFGNAGPLLSSSSSVMSHQSSIASSNANQDVFPSNEGGIFVITWKIDSFKLCRMSTLPTWYMPHHACLCKNHLPWLLWCAGALLLSSPLRVKYPLGYLRVDRASPGEELRYHVDIGPSVNYLTTVCSRQARVGVSFPLRATRVFTP